MSIISTIGHYQRSIEKSSLHEDRLLHCIGKLYKLPVTVEHLQETGVGKTVNSLRKYNGEVGVAAKALVTKWKAMVAAEEELDNSNYDENENEDNENNTDKYNSMCNNESKKNLNNSNEGNSKATYDRLDENPGNNLNNCDTKYTYNNKNSYEGKQDKCLLVNSENKCNGYKNITEDILQLNALPTSQDIEEALNDDEDEEKLIIDINTKEKEDLDLKMKSERNSKEINTKNINKSHKSRHKDKDKRLNKSDCTVGNRSKKDKNKRQPSKETKKNSLDSDEKDFKKPIKNEKDDSKEIKRRHSKCNENIKSKKIQKIQEEGIDSSTGTSFEEALGMFAIPLKSSKMKSPKSNSSKSTSDQKSPNSKTPELLISPINLQPLDSSINLQIPTISPNYKPMPLNQTVMDCVFSQNNKSQRRLLTDEEALQAGISSKTVRTKVYSGIRTGQIVNIPSLFDLCIRILQKNIDALEYTGGVPFDILRPILDRATPQQLQIFEDFNPYVMDDTDILWQQHCSRHYRSQKREEMETWRDMFMRCKEEQNARLNILAENIKQSQKQITQPLRKTQLAYIDSAVKPPRNIKRKQEQFGTKVNISATPAARVAALSNLTSQDMISKKKIAQEIKDFSTGVYRPRKAPLMQKSLQLMKGRFKR